MSSSKRTTLVFSLLSCAQMGLKTNALVGAATVVAMASVPTMMNYPEIGSGTDGQMETVNSVQTESSRGGTSSALVDDELTKALELRCISRQRNRDEQDECCSVEPTTQGCELEPIDCSLVQVTWENQEFCCSEGMDTTGCLKPATGKPDSHERPQTIEDCDFTYSDPEDIEFCCSLDIRSAGCTNGQSDTKCTRAQRTEMDREECCGIDPESVGCQKPLAED
jgi:hypothetical protein